MVSLLQDGFSGALRAELSCRSTESISRLSPNIPGRTGDLLLLPAELSDMKQVVSMSSGYTTHPVSTASRQSCQHVPAWQFSHGEHKRSNNSNSTLVPRAILSVDRAGQLIQNSTELLHENRRKADIEISLHPGFGFPRHGHPQAGIQSLARARFPIPGFSIES